MSIECSKGVAILDIWLARVSMDMDCHVRWGVAIE